MPTQTVAKKIKITLSDYPFRKDIENRLLMAQFSVFETQVLESILDNSLQIQLQELEESFAESKAHLPAALDKLMETNLFKRVGSNLIIDKDVRKYLEAQIVKFDCKFASGIEYIKSLLRKVPIDVLPTWYALPRTSDDIFGSINEKFLQTPKIFQRHIEETCQEIPLLSKIIEELHASANFEFPFLYFCEKYKISKEAFGELMLTLEFHFICCINYRLVNDKWEEVVTFFSEWKEYLSFLKNSKNLKKPALQTKAPFEFVRKLTMILETTLREPVSTLNIEEKMLKTLIDLRVAEVKGTDLYALKDAELYLELSEEKKAHLIYRIQNSESDKAIREVEKNVRKVAKEGWVFFDEFVKGCTASVGTASEISLKKIGKKWAYALPDYTPEEVQIIKRIIFEKFFEAGFVHTETVEGRDCFSVTAFGQKMLD